MGLQTMSHIKVFDIFDLKGLVVVEIIDAVLPDKDQQTCCRWISAIVSLSHNN